MKPWVCVRGFYGREVFRILTGDRTLAPTFLRFADVRDTARWLFCKAAFWFLAVLVTVYQTHPAASFPTILHLFHSGTSVWRTHPGSWRAAAHQMWRIVFQSVSQVRDQASRPSIVLPSSTSFIGRP